MSGDESIATIILHDVHPLFGGQNVYINEKGNTLVQSVYRSEKQKQSGLREKRYIFDLNKAEFEKITTVVYQHFFNIDIHDRLGVPDEAKPTITVKTTNGKSRKVAKWANDTDRHFDIIYSELLHIVKLAETRKSIYEGKFDINWQPREVQNL